MFWDAHQGIWNFTAIDVADHHHVVLEMFGAVLTIAFCSHRHELASEQLCVGHRPLQNCELTKCAIGRAAERHAP